jgi:hypothetical protein
VPFACFISEPCPPVHPVTAEKLSIVIIYERLAYVSKAVATCLHLTRGLADKFSPDFRLWRLDLTLDPAFSCEAEQDLADADVIIMAVNGRQLCPPEFQRWKKGAGHVGGPAPHAIIALMDTPEDPEPTVGSWSGLLQVAATRIHSEVFVCEQPEGSRRALG